MTPPEEDIKDFNNSDIIVNVPQREVEAWRVGVAVFAWFSLALVFNWSSKGSLILLPNPITFTMVQVVAVMLYAAIAAKIQGSPIEPPSKKLLYKMIPLGVLQLTTKLLHQLALAHVGVSFVHTVKVSAPFFSLILGRIVLGEVPLLRMALSVVPIVTGVVLCMETSVEYNAAGMIFSILGTFSIVCQNIFSKKIFTEKHASGLTLVFYTDLTAFLLLVPLWLHQEGLEVLPKLLDGRVATYVIMNGASSFLQTFVSFFVIVHTTGLTYSILTVLKRAVLILGSIFYYGDLLTSSRLLGLAVAFFGVSWYTKIKYDLKREEVKSQGQDALHQIELGLKMAH